MTGFHYINNKTGKIYKVIGVGRHSEDPQIELVVYQRVDGDSQIWCRPLELWDIKFTLVDYGDA